MNYNSPTIGIIDYGMGNLRNVVNALKYLGINSFVSNKKDELSKSDGLILPGVGAFYDAMQNLQKLNMDKFILEKVKENTPLLGICLGMQVLFSTGHEVEYCQGLSIMEGKVIKFQKGLKVPHMGWNKLIFLQGESKLLKNIPFGSYVYFVHSFYVSEAKQELIKATANYGQVFPALVERDNVFGTQFHPEKSGDLGLKILNNYVEVLKERRVNIKNAH